MAEVEVAPAVTDPGAEVSAVLISCQGWHLTGMKSHEDPTAEVTPITLEEDAVPEVCGIATG